MNVFRKVAAAAVIAIIATAAPLASHADTGCDSKIVIFSGNSNVGAVNSNAAACAVNSDGSLPYDGRVINPGSDYVAVRYTTDLGDLVPTLKGHLSGLGIDEDITLTRSFNSTLSFWSYNTDNIPLDATQQGCITATVHVDPTDPTADESDVWHTIGQFC